MVQFQIPNSNVDVLLAEVMPDAIHLVAGAAGDAMRARPRVLPLAGNTSFTLFIHPLGADLTSEPENTFRVKIPHRVTLLILNMIPLGVLGLSVLAGHEILAAANSRENFFHHGDQLIGILDTGFRRDFKILRQGQSGVDRKERVATVLQEERRV